MTDGEQKQALRSGGQTGSRKGKGLSWKKETNEGKPRPDIIQRTGRGTEKKKKKKTKKKTKPKKHPKNNPHSGTKRESEREIKQKNDKGKRPRQKKR